MGIIWALIGWIRGRLQPETWSTLYALRRWLLRTLVWSLALAAVAAAGHYAWRRFTLGTGAGLLPEAWRSVILLAVALAVVPAAAGEMRAGREQERIDQEVPGRPWTRQLLPVLVGCGLAAVLLVGGHLLGPLWQQADLEQPFSSAQAWIQERWAGVEATINDFIDQLYIRYYDRRAPLQATPSVEPGAVPATTPQPGGGGAEGGS